MSAVGVQQGVESRYYTALGRATDYILRCKDCKAISAIDRIKQLAGCACGNKRFSEITTLSEAEMAEIEAGVLDFPHRDAFLKEFSPVE